jgi:hypothetical protein
MSKTALDNLALFGGSPAFASFTGTLPPANKLPWNQLSGDKSFTQNGLQGILCFSG